MRFKKLGVALLAVVALSAIAVGNASAAATTTAAEWYTGASPGTTLTGSAGANLAIKSGTIFILTSQVGSPPQPLKLTATGVECLGCTIENKAGLTGASVGAFGTGKVRFTGVKVDEPLNCTVTPETAGVEEGTITTRQLNVHADFMNGSTAVQQFIPTAGAGTPFAAFRLMNATTGTCPVAGLYSVTGTLFADASNATGVQATTQQVNISPAIETADGGGLFIGSQPANLTGSGVFSLSSGAQFGIH